MNDFKEHRRNYMNNYYEDKNKKQLKVTIDADDYLIIDNHCKESNISKASFIARACKYIIDNNIDIR